MTILAIEALRKAYGGIRALDGASLSIDKPGIYGLIGPNGAGKTTLFDAVCGQVTPDSGRILLRGRDVTGLAPYRLARMGLARSFQECRILPEETCLDNLLFAAQDKRLPGVMRRMVTFAPGTRGTRRDQALALLDMVNLLQYAGSRAENLSFGQRRLLEVVSTFMMEPDVVLLDEPASGINPTLLNTLFDFIVRMHEERAAVFLIVEHNMEFIMRISHDVTVMHEGSVLDRGDPETIQNSPRVIGAYLG